MSDEKKDDELNIEDNSAELNDYEVELDEAEKKGLFSKIIDRIKRKFS